MAMQTRNQMSVESTQAVITSYFVEHDVTRLAEDAEFTIMGTGQKFQGREGVQQMLDYFYHMAFEAQAEPTNMVFAPGQAVAEAEFVGKHLAEFAGVPASGKEVRIPMCLVYDLSSDQIVRGRVYFETPAFLQQVGAM